MLLTYLSFLDSKLYIEKSFSYKNPNSVFLSFMIFKVHILSLSLLIKTTKLLKVA